MTQGKLTKDYGTRSAVWSCNTAKCKIIYSSDELITSDLQDHIIWGRVRPDSILLIPICSIHGTFLLYDDVGDLNKNIVTH